MKKTRICPSCSQEVALSEMMCPYCRALLPVVKIKEPWYFKPGFMVTAFLCFGPLMLPLLWWHPTLARKTKIVWTVVLFSAMWLLWRGMVSSLKVLTETYGFLFGGKLPQY